MKYTVKCRNVRPLGGDVAEERVSSAVEVAVEAPVPVVESRSGEVEGSAPRVLRKKRGRIRRKVVR